MNLKFTQSSIELTSTDRSLITMAQFHLILLSVCYGPVIIYNAFYGLFKSDETTAAVFIAVLVMVSAVLVAVVDGRRDPKDLRRSHTPSAGVQTLRAAVHDDRANAETLDTAQARETRAISVVGACFRRGGCGMVHYARRDQAADRNRGNPAEKRRV